MAFQDFISEQEAAKIAGVSLATLNRFAEAGYLKTESDHDGLRMYLKNEVSDLFGVPEEKIESRQEDYVLNSFESIPTTPNTTPPTTNPSPIKTLSTEKLFSDNPIIEQHLESLSKERVIDLKLTANEDVETNSQNTTESLSRVKLEKEAYRLRTLVDLMERLLDNKDRELTDLRNQREWLQARIERLEEKSERDQILLLSETQTIKKLITIQEDRPGTFRTLLGWLGLNASSVNNTNK